MTERSLGNVKGQVGIEVTGATASLEQLLDSVNKTISTFQNLDSVINTSGNTLNGVFAQISSNSSKSALEYQKHIGMIKESNTVLVENTKQSADKIILNLNNVASTAQTIASKLAGISIGFGVSLKEGLEASVTLATIERRFTAITGSQEKAKEVMKQIADEAHRFGQNSLQAQQGIIALVPNLKNGVKDLGQFTGLALRLASIKPAQGIEGAVYAINEALSSGNFRSLVERFEIGRSVMREALQQTSGDWGKALDIVLNKMGATEKAAIEAGQQWNASANLLKESFDRALSAGLQPFLNVLSTILKGTADFLDNVRETSPWILTVATGFMAATVAAGGLALAISQISRALSLVQAQVSSSFLGNLGKLFAVGAGVEVGKFAYGKLTGEKPEEVNDKFNKILVVGVDLIVKAFIGAATLVTKLFYNAGLEIQKIINNIQGKGYKTNEELRIEKIQNEQSPTLREDTIKYVTKLSLERINQELKMRGEAKSDFTNKDQAVAYYVQQIMAQFEGDREGFKNADEEFFKNLDKAGVEMEKKFLETIGAIQGQGTPQGITDGGIDTSGKVSQFNEEQLDAWIDYTDRLTEINRRFHDESLKEEDKYNRDRAQKVSEFNKNRDRELEDETIRRQRAQEDLDRDIADKIRDGEQKQADIVKSRQDKITDIISKSSEDEEKKRQEHFEKLAKIERDANRSMIDAAQHLDAEGVRKAIQRRDDAIRDENDQFAKGKKELQEKREQDVQEEIKSTERKLEESRVANQREIEQMRERFRIEEGERRADFSRKRERDLQDFNSEMALYDAEHIRKMNDIRTQAELERQQAQQKFIREFDAAEQSENRKLQMTRNFYAQQENALAVFITNMRSRLANAESQAYGVTTRVSLGASGEPRYTTYQPGHGMPITRFAPGTSFVSKDGPHYLEMGEGIIPSSANTAIRGLLGNNYTGMQLVNALNRKSSGTGGITIQSFAPKLEFGDIGSYSRQEIFEIAKDALLDSLQEVNQELHG